jgi:hypothetical protein
VVVAVALGAMAVPAACGKDEPAPAAQKPAPIDRSLHIEIEVEGRPEKPVDAARLESTPPDFADGPHKAWKLRTFLGEAFDAPDTAVEVTGDGMRVTFDRPGKAVDGRVPVLLTNLRGQVVLALVDEKDPFPSFHGRGGNRGRPPEEAAIRIRRVEKISVVRRGGAQ